MTPEFLVCVQDWAAHLPGALPIVLVSEVEPTIVQIDSYGYGVGRWCFHHGRVAHIVEQWTAPMLRSLMLRVS